MSRRIIGEHLKSFMPEEKRRFLEAVDREGNERDKMIMHFLFTTGLRLGEMVSLNVEKVKDKSIMTYRVLKQKKIMSNDLPISRDLQEQLKKYLDYKKSQGEHVHPRSPLFTITGRQIQRLVDRYVKLAGLERSFHPHCFRHTRAIELIRDNVPIQVVAGILGHTNINSTFVYTQPSLQDKQKALYGTGQQVAEQHLTTFQR